MHFDSWAEIKTFPQSSARETKQTLAFPDTLWMTFVQDDFLMDAVKRREETGSTQLEQLKMVETEGVEEPECSQGIFATPAWTALL